jgi:hypothetical protein
MFGVDQRGDTWSGDAEAGEILLSRAFANRLLPACRMI